MVVVLLCAVASQAALPATCPSSTPSYTLDYREAWDKPAFSFFDIRSASVEKYGSRFAFQIQVYGEVTSSSLAAYRFLLKTSGTARVVVLEATGGAEDSPGWQLRKGSLDANGAPTQMSALCENCVVVEGGTLSFEVTEAQLGLPSSFSWAAWAAMKVGPLVMWDRSPDGDAFISWPGQFGGDSCSCNRLAILSSRPEYKIGDELTITLFVTKPAQVQVTDTSGGATTTLWTGTLSQGIHSLAEILFPEGGGLAAALPLGPEEVAITATIEGTCTGRAATTFTVVR